MAKKTIVTLTSPDGATLNTAGKYCEGDIEVVPKLQEKTATTGEVVTADEGYVGLKSVDTTPVFEAGKKSEYDAFWNAYQLSGTRKQYQYAFAGGGWNLSSFKPKYNIVPSSARGMFVYGGLSNVDLAEVLLSLGIVFDTSKITTTDGFFNLCYYGGPSRFPVISTVRVPGLNAVFDYASLLVTIDKLILKEDGSQTFSNVFRGCTALTNLTIEGTIGQNGFNVSWSPLSKASLTSIVNALSSTTTGLTVTVRASAVKKAFETSEGANDGMSSEEWLTLVATKPNWTINAIDS